MTGARAAANHAGRAIRPAGLASMRSEPWQREAALDHRAELLDRVLGVEK